MSCHACSGVWSVHDTSVRHYHGSQHPPPPSLRLKDFLGKNLRPEICRKSLSRFLCQGFWPEDFRGQGSCLYFPQNPLFPAEGTGEQCKTIGFQCVPWKGCKKPWILQGFWGTWEPCITKGCKNIGFHKVPQIAQNHAKQKGAKILVSIWFRGTWNHADQKGAETICPIGCLTYLKTMQNQRVQKTFVPITFWGT